MKKLKIILVFKIIFLVLSIFYIFGYYFNHKSKYFGNEKEFYGYIKSIKIDGDKLNLVISAKENLNVNYYFNTEIEKNNFDLKIGDYVKIYGELDVPSSNTNFNLFNYKKYLLSKKIYYSIKCSKIEKIKDGNILYKMKNLFIEKIDKIPNNSYIKALIIGDNSDIDTEYINSYRSNGISHLFAISGMHVSFIILFINKLLEKIIKNKKICDLVITIFLIFYSFLASFAVSILRAVLMHLFGLIFKYLKIKISTIEIFVLTLIIIMIYNPFIIYNISFKYSFVISFYLILFNKLIREKKNYFTKLFMTSLIAFLASVPIQINNFFSINILALFFNLFFVPFFTFIIFPFSILVFIFPFLNPIFIFFISILENISCFLEAIRFGTFIMSHVPFFIVIIYYIAITLTLYKMKNKNYRYLLLICFILLVHHNINYLRKYLMITMLDVGQGDSLLISLNNSKGNILIDTGGKYNYNEVAWKKRKNKYDISSNIIIPYLKSVGIRKIDYLVITHGDYDHMGESINLVNNFKVENVIFNCGEFNDLENELIDALDKKDIKYYSCVSELNINKYKLQFLNTGIYDDENTSSSVIYLNYDNYKFLFMGDASIEREKDILKKYNSSNIDFLKIGHHGSNTSSSEEFINSINPRYSLISVGKNNRYGHPKEEDLDTLKNSKIYRTDLDGSIEIKLNKNGYKIRTCNP